DLCTCLGAWRPPARSRPPGAAPKLPMHGPARLASSCPFVEGLSEMRAARHRRPLGPAPPVVGLDSHPGPCEASHAGTPAASPGWMRRGSALRLPLVAASVREFRSSETLLRTSSRPKTAPADFYHPRTGASGSPPTWQPFLHR